MHEVRVLRIPSNNPQYPPKNLCGFFDLNEPRHLWDAIKMYLAKPEKEQPEGIYITINPVLPDLLATANNALKGGRIAGAADAQIQTRNFFYVDVDPVRIAKISTTDEEKAAALEVFTGVRAELDGRGFPPPMVIDSGNGYHAWYRVELPADDGGKVERALKSLAGRHNTPKAKVDTSVFNPSRICKIPGTWARKGDSLATRPHRVARVLEVPDPC